MKSGDMSKTTAIIVACLSIAMYAMAQRGGGPPEGMPSQSKSGQQQSQSMPQQNQMNAPTTPQPIGSPSPAAKMSPSVKTSPTPRGHHYGWQKGKHNPHRSPTP
jgi:hypothetical protein